MDKRYTQYDMDFLYLEIEKLRNLNKQLSSEKEELNNKYKSCLDHVDRIAQNLMCHPDMIIYHIQNLIDNQND